MLHFSTNGMPLNTGKIRFRAVGYTVGETVILDGIDLEVFEGETVILLGESGCGKTTTLKMVNRLIEPTTGEVLVDGRSTTDWDSIKLRLGIGYVLQESGLLPHFSVAKNVGLVPRLLEWDDHRLRRRVDEMLDLVGLLPAQFADRYPHELSGGQRQRVNIARALALAPRLVILDEAVSALDKSVEAQVLNLLIDLKKEFELTYIFISHDLHVIRFISDRIVVMYLGEVVESGPVDSVWDEPRHPYTEALFAAMPSLDPDRRTEKPPIAGDPPNPIDPPSGCRFHTRCAFAETVCSASVPKLSPVGVERHFAACHMVDPQSGHSLSGTRQGALSNA